MDALGIADGRTGDCRWTHWGLQKDAPGIAGGLHWGLQMDALGIADGRTGDCRWTDWGLRSDAMGIADGRPGEWMMTDRGVKVAALWVGSCAYVGSEPAARHV